MPMSSPLTPDASRPPGRKPTLPDIIPTDTLFQGNQEILISHNGEHYRLRITKNGKLILTK
ncbi:MAG: hemin uptake protein HemP [Thiobacillus sp.]|nr:hemin uptake protein HemP [Thiobacillus sp.]